MAEEVQELRGMLLDVGRLLSGDKEFQHKQAQFFDQHCDEFTHEEENKLSWTGIHQSYQEMVDSELDSKLGRSEIERLAVLLEKHQASVLGKQKDQDEEDRVVFATVETLSSMTDFEVFKAAMLAKQDDKLLRVQPASSSAFAQGKETLVDTKGVKQHVLNIDALFQECEKLRIASDGSAGGWERFAEGTYVIKGRKGEKLECPVVLDVLRTQDPKNSFCRWRHTFPVSIEHVGGAEHDLVSRLHRFRSSLKKKHCRVSPSCLAV
jgi:hypothetical protein